ncbi:MAG: hypothetical protein ACRC7C_08325 [Beijerinckiaceae bacterium]
MSTLKNVAFAVAAFGFFAASSAAEAQYYYHPQYGYVQQQPQWVNPRIARKQAQQTERFIEKFGYQQPRYAQPRYVQPGYGHQPRRRHYQPDVYHYPQPGYGRGYNQGW